jgi:nucleoside-diphosphate-sugar epimerase
VSEAKTYPLAVDSDHIFFHTAGILEELRGKRLFITGGTGFFGRWLLESLVDANRRQGLNISAWVLTRDPASFQKRAPHLAADPAIQFHKGDVRTFDFPTGDFSHIIHCATTTARETFEGQDPATKHDIVAEGTRHTLDFAVHCHARRFLMTSSGVVYGKQPSDMTHISEDFTGAPEPSHPNFALGNAKRAAELLCAQYSEKHGFDATIARCFSFFGPGLPLDIHYAIGNFIRDGLSGGPIRVQGDGSPFRSYLYVADLVIWLWTLLLRGASGRAYNVGSEVDMKIAELADSIAHIFMPPLKVQIARAPDLKRPVERYVPSTERARRELGLRQFIDLETGIERTLQSQGALLGL